MRRRNVRKSIFRHTVQFRSVDDYLRHVIILIGDKGKSSVFSPGNPYAFGRNKSVFSLNDRYQITDPFKLRRYYHVARHRKDGVGRFFSVNGQFFQTETFVCNDLHGYRFADGIFRFLIFDRNASVLRFFNLYDVFVGDVKFYVNFVISVKITQRKTIARLHPLPVNGNAFYPVPFGRIKIEADRFAAISGNFTLFYRTVAAIYGRNLAVGRTGITYFCHTDVNDRLNHLFRAVKIRQSANAYYVACLDGRHL